MDLMQAAVIERPGRIALTDAPVPEPGPGEIVFRVEGCGLCASSIPLFEGRDWFEYPAPPGHPGHEAWGTVAATGRGVQGLKAGDRIGAISYNGYAEYDKTRADMAVRLPDALNGRPFPGEALGCAMNILERSDIRRGHAVAVVGAGFLGALLVQLASRIGAEVIAVSRRPSSLLTALDCGASLTVPMDDHRQIIDRVERHTSGALCERVIETTGKEWPLNLAGELTAERGRLVIAGFHQDGMRKVNVQLWNWRGLDVINAHERAPERYVWGMAEAVEAVASGRIHTDPVLTHAYSLDDIQQGFEHLVDRPANYVKGYIRI